MFPVQEFDFRAHDSAFKDRYLQLQNVRVKFIPTEKKDIHEEGPIDEVKKASMSMNKFDILRYSEKKSEQFNSTQAGC